MNAGRGAGRLTWHPFHPPRLPMQSDIEIAQAAQMRPILALAQERLAIPEDQLEPYGRYKA